MFDAHIFIVNDVEVRLRRDNRHAWANENPILKDGEPGFDTTTFRIKRGDGVTPWNDLPWFAVLV